MRKPMTTQEAVQGIVGLIVIGFFVSHWLKGPKETPPPITPAQVAAAPAPVRQRQPNGVSHDIFTSDAAQAKPWHGPTWRNKHLTTDLDQVFIGGETSRIAIRQAIGEMTMFAWLAVYCEQRSQAWMDKFQFHMTEIQEDKAAWLGDPDMPKAIEDTEGRAIKLAGSNFDKDPDRACLAVRGARELREADEITRRTLHRTHDQWEGLEPDTPPASNGAGTAH